jgi:hypothetical protein
VEERRDVGPKEFADWRADVLNVEGRRIISKLRLPGIPFEEAKEVLRL